MDDVADVRPFRALRPRPELAARVAAPPYDVVDVAEARALAAGNPVSFLHVSRPEIDLPDDVDPGADAVHAAGRRTLDRFVADGVLSPDETPTFSVYRQRSGSHVQTGLVACVAVADYDDGTIRTHEHTRPDKEDDRVRHIDALDAHDEPVLLLTPPGDPQSERIRAIVAQVVSAPPLHELATDDGIGHEVWRVEDEGVVKELVAAFADVETLYVADGHHRSAAATRVAALRHGSGESDAFLAVIFPGEDLAILPYNRVVADLAGHTLADLLSALGPRFHVSPSPIAVEPTGPGIFGLYCSGRWFVLGLREPVPGDGAPADGHGADSHPADSGQDPVARLDVSLLQDRVLGPLLGIADPRTDRRIGFVGGSRGTAELVRLVDEGRYAAAFSLHPTSVDDLVAVAATGRVMPPKSTWFEPKLRSGLFVHRLCS